MNGLASDTTASQSLLQPSENFPVAADNAGAGSTANSDSQSSLHDAPTSTDPNSSAIIPENSPTNDAVDPGTQDLPTAVGTESEVIQTAGVIIEGKDKGGATAEEVPQAEPLETKQETDTPLEPANGQIELLEHTPEPAGGAGEAGLIVQEDGQDWMADSDHELKRVKVSKSSDFIPLRLV